MLSVDGREVARKSMEHGTPVTFPEDEAFDIGQDTRSAVSMLEYRYDVPFKFTGKIDKLTVNLAPAAARTGVEAKAEMGTTMTAPEPDPIDNGPSR